ncbi:hypothetical protein [Dysgonomonas termitidis]|uniref:Uncharacterized protein n=1 Tax=Dysgonomonas termitidis TaxID=1516126 RepID=A0ABV9KZZ0_9BACT
MKNYKLLILVLSVVLFSMISCLDPVESDRSLEALPSESVFDIEVYPLTPGTNAIVLKNNTTQYAPYWNYVAGISTRQIDTVFIPYTGEYTITFTGMCDGGPVSTQRKVIIASVDWPKYPSDEVELLLKYDFEDGTFNPLIGTQAKLSATSFDNHIEDGKNNVTFVPFEAPEGIGVRRCIHDFGQLPEHINCTSETEVLNATTAGSQKSDYLTFTVTPEAGKRLDLKWLSFKLQARTTERLGNNKLSYFAALYSNVDGFSVGKRLGNPVEVFANEVNTVSGWVMNEVDISSLATQKDKPVEFRIYFWRIGNADPRNDRFVELDDVKLHGFVVNE